MEKAAVMGCIVMGCIVMGIHKPLGPLLAGLHVN